MIDNQTLHSLAEKRPLFHSEDDFKFSLAQHLASKSDKIRIEVPQELSVGLKGKKGNKIVRYIYDLVIHVNDKVIPIELKYKTKALDNFNFKVPNETFLLKNQSGHPNTLRNVRKDVFRIEQFLERNKKSSIGFVIFLTNDRRYWKGNKSKYKPLAYNYELKDNQCIGGKDKGWCYERFKGRKPNNHWTIRGDYSKLHLNGSYKICWHDYEGKRGSSLSKCSVARTSPSFRFIIVKIEKPN